VDIEKVKAILVTLIITLLIGIVIFTFRINEVRQDQVTLQVDLGEQPPTPEELKEQELIERQLKMEKIADALIRNENRSNIGVNTAEKLKEEISTEKYADQLKRELAANKPSLPGDNANAQSPANKKADDKDGMTEQEKELEKKKQNENSKTFKGLTNIYYELANRKNMYLPVPVYMCQGSGKVFIQIEVNQHGDVSSATIDKSQSDADECLHQAAIDAARATRFNADYKNAPAKQKGTITYLFVAQ